VNHSTGNTLAEFQVSLEEIPSIAMTRMDKSGLRWTMLRNHAPTCQTIDSSSTVFFFAWMPNGPELTACGKSRPLCESRSAGSANCMHARHFTSSGLILVLECIYTLSGIW
jgi:hypothetical protein